MMTVFSSRPKDSSSRLLKELRVYDFLESLSIPFERVDHPSAFTMEDCAVPEKMLDTKICKNLFLCNRQQTDFYLLMMPAEKSFHTKDLSPQLGCSRLSFAAPEAMERLLDITPGSMSVLGLMNDRERKVQLLVDQELLSQETIGAHPCTNTSTLKLKTKDVFERFVPATGHHLMLISLPNE